MVLFIIMCNNMNVARTDYIHCILSWKKTKIQYNITNNIY